MNHIDIHDGYGPPGSLSRYVDRREAAIKEGWTGTIKLNCWPYYEADIQAGRLVSETSSMSQEDDAEREEAEARAA